MWILPKKFLFFWRKKTGFTVIGHQLGFIESEIPVSTKLDFGWEYKAYYSDPNLVLVTLALK